MQLFVDEGPVAMSKNRRVITSTGSDGHSFLEVHDDPPPCRFSLDNVTMDQLWLTTTAPADPSSDELGKVNPKTAYQQPPAFGTLFELCTFEPGFSSPMHRTDTIDYVVVLSGQVDLQVEDGTTVSLSPGDTVVQLAATHRWVNRGADACSIAVVLVSTRSQTSMPDGIEVYET